MGDLWLFITEKIGLGSLSILIAVIGLTWKIAGAHKDVLTEIKTIKTDTAGIKEDIHEIRDERSKSDADDDRKHDDHYRESRRMGESIAEIKGRLGIAGDRHEAQD